MALNAELILVEPRLLHLFQESNNKPLLEVLAPITGSCHLPSHLKTYYCPIEIIKGLTDKGQFQYLTKLKGPQAGNYLYTTQFLPLRLRSILYHKLPNPFMGPLYCPCKEVIITSL